MWDLIDEKLGAYLRLGKGEALEQYVAEILLGRVQTPGRCGRVRLLPGGPDSDYMTGQSVLIEGGLVMR